MTHIYPERPANSVWGDDQHDMSPVEEPDELDDAEYGDGEYVEETDDEEDD